MSRIVKLSETKDFSATKYGTGWVLDGTTEKTSQVSKILKSRNLVTQTLILYRCDSLPLYLPPLLLLRPLRVQQTRLGLQVRPQREEMILLRAEVALEVADLLQVTLLKIPGK